MVALVVVAALAVVAALLSRRDPKVRRVRIGLFVERERFKNDDKEEKR